MAMFCAGEPEPVYPSVVEPASHGAVEIGWPSHLAPFLSEVKVPIPAGHAYATAFYPAGARASVAE
eukprot:4016908-Lingulodinium_polyedra.AAC.1